MKCILITGGFPFGTSEAFLENEIGFLAQKFQEVHIYSLEAKGECRNIPSNVFATKIPSPNFFEKVIFSLKSFFAKKHLNEKCSLLKKINYFYFKGKSIFFYKSIMKHIKHNHLQFEKNTIVYSYWLCLPSMVAFYIKENLGLIKAVSRCHRCDIYCEIENHNYIPLQETSMYLLDKIYPCSDDGCTYLKKKFPRFANKISLARLGTMDYGLTPLFSKENNKQIVFVTCSRLTTIKRVDFFARIFAKLDKKYNVKWFCIGDGPERGKICEIVKDSNVEFLGNISNSEVMNFYKENRIDFFVNVSISEGAPVSIMEAQSFGIPVIATDVGGTSEIVNNENGILVPCDISENDFLNNIICAMETNLDEKRQKSRINWEEKSSAFKNFSLWVDELTKGEER